VSLGDTYATPMPVFHKLNKEFKFKFDVCAEHSTAKCFKYWTIDDDSLSKNWVTDTGAKKGEWLWCNPPYSKIHPWVLKAIESQIMGVGTVMLVMCDPSVKWFSVALEYASEVRYITNGRLSFERNGKPVNGNNKGSVIFVFNPYAGKGCLTRYVDRSSFYE
tara:strand:- start:1837 stop:2322 length:486 start_codon:yes stop_codon:yes gene_type:complete